MPGILNHILKNWPVVYSLHYSKVWRKLWRKKTVGKTVGKLLGIIMENPKITTEEMALKTGLSIRGVEYNLNKLKEEGLLKRIGPAKGGHWEVLDK